MNKRIIRPTIVLLFAFFSTFAYGTIPFETTVIDVKENCFDTNVKWYTITIGSSGMFISDNGNKDHITIKNRQSRLDDADLWCFTGNEQEGYKIYNKQAGTNKVLSAPVKMSGDAGSEAFVLLKEENTPGYNCLWTFSQSTDLGKETKALYMMPKGTSHKVNNRAGKLAFWTSGADSGSSIVITFAKTTIPVNMLSGIFTNGNTDNTWFSSWKSDDKKHPITINSDANNMKKSGKNLVCYTGTANSSSYTINAPEGYYISEISMNKVIRDNNRGNAKIYYAGQEVKEKTTYTDKGKQEQSLTFKLSDKENSGIIIKDLAVTIARSTKKPEPHFDLFPTTTTEAIPYRIPAITTTANGNLLAVADYRHCRYDIGNGRIDLHGRISKDNGKTWGEIFTIIEGDGILKKNDRNSSLTAGYGDPCLVADRESDKVLLLCVCGYQTFPYATRDIPNQAARLYSEDGGATWSKPEVITEMFYAPFDNSKVGPIRSMFIGSGRIFQSRLVKTKDYYRLYAAMLAKDKDGTNCNFVVYSDDFGKEWKVLGSIDKGAIPAYADEPKTEELPDGSIVISSRCGGGRYFNIFRFSDPQKAEGEWGEYAFSGEKNNGVTALQNSCNGEIMIIPAIRNKDGKQLYIALQSLPFGGGRSNVGIYYKELDNYEDFLTPVHFAKDWDGRHKSSITGSAYSTMTLQANDSIAFIYEEDTYGTNGGGYTIVYKQYSIETITDGKYTYDKNENRALYLIKNVITPIKEKMSKQSAN